MANNQVKIYCGTKSTLPDGYGRFGTRYECMQCGFGSALMQYKWAPASNDPRPPARKKRGCYRPRNPKESRSSERDSRSSERDSRSPPRKRRKRSSRSPSRKRRKRSSRSPSRKRRKRSSRSPSRKRRKRSSPSPSRKRRKRSSRSPSRKRRKRSSPSPSRKRRKRSSPSRSQINRWIKEELRRSRRKPCKRGQIRDRSSKRCRRKKCYPKVRDRKSKRCRSPRRRRSRGASEEKRNN